MAHSRHVGKYIFWLNDGLSDLQKFYTKTQNPSTMTVKRQKFRILVIQDSAEICTEIYERR